VPLRDEWVHEAHAFTIWLAEKGNLALLGDEIGVDIDLIETESGVGSFYVDILAKEATSDRKIIIENQLERTNHDHLGKLITYASGKKASFIIWLVASEREEHKRAIDWLNEHTDDEVSFFLVRIELWQIGESSRAPKFVIVSQPNGWAKAAGAASEGGKITDTKIRQLRFWEALCEWGQDHGTAFKLRTPRPQHWFDISSGSSRWHLSLTLNTKESEMACEVNVPNSKDLFRVFLKYKTDIENEVGAQLDWMELPGKLASRIKLSKEFDLDDESRWEEYSEWLLTTVGDMRKAFSKIKVAGESELSAE
jgi:hypothetical protein